MELFRSLRRRPLAVALVLLSVLAITVPALVLGRHYQAARLAASQAPAVDSSQTLVAIAGEASPDLTAAPTPEDTMPELREYTVKEGDNLWNLAEEFGISLSTLTSVNKLNENTVLAIGQTLKVMSVDGTTHKVVSGDTLTIIAKTYKVTEEAILAANTIDPASLPVGTLLLIPGGKAPAPTRPATTPPTVTRGSSTRPLVWPVKGRISSAYGWRTHPISGKKDFHEGLDIAAPSGTAIVAAAEGVVVYAAYKGGYGYTVIIEHTGGLQTQYSHNSSNQVSVGQKVKQGQQIAKVGMTGSATGPHVHFMVFLNWEYASPLSYLR